MTSENIKTNIATNLNARMHEIGMSQTQLSKISGIKQPNISAYIRQTRTPDVNTLYRLCKILNMSMQDMIKEREGSSYDG